VQHPLQCPLHVSRPTLVEPKMGCMSMPNVHHVRKRNKGSRLDERDTISKPGVGQLMDNDIHQRSVSGDQG
jgi:hypothetical protein